MGLDLERIGAAAADSFLRQPPAQPDRSRRSRRIGRAGAVAVGIAIGVAGRAAWDRVRSLDLERVASALEARLKD